MPSITVENYLKALYVLQQKNADERVPIGKLADSVGVTPGTATTMVKRLSNQQWVDYESWAGVRLTEQGSQHALQVLRRHRLLELFLVEVLAFDWSEVHDEAEVLEHAVSDRLLAKIDHYLNYPAYDPHGDPIPNESGQLCQQELIPLSQCEQGLYQISRIADHHPDYLNFLNQRGLLPGTRIEILSHDALADVMTIVLEKGDVEKIGSASASKILVAAINPQAS